LDREKRLFVSAGGKRKKGHEPKFRRRKTGSRTGIGWKGLPAAEGRTDCMKRRETKSKGEKKTEFALCLRKLHSRPLPGENRLAKKRTNDPKCIGGECPSPRKQEKSFGGKSLTLATHPERGGEKRECNPTPLEGGKSHSSNEETNHRLRGERSIHRNREKKRPRFATELKISMPL